MDMVSIAVWTAVLAAGAALGWWLRSLRGRAESDARAAAMEERLAGRERESAGLQQRLDDAVMAAKASAEDSAGLRANLAGLQAELKAERESAAEKLAAIDRAREALVDAFKSLSAEALRTNNEQFLQLAGTAMQRFQERTVGDLDLRQQAIGELVKPVRESLDKFEGVVRDIEKERAGAYQGLMEQVRGLQDTQERLRAEASSLVKALGTPRVRGRWGEIQLRRVVEIAGMMDHCDFEEQVNLSGPEGPLRPDMVVRLPGGRRIAVDAKAPLAAYLEALEASDEDVRRARMRDHSRQIRDHITSLGRKAYWDQLGYTPEFVVLFLPGETFFSAALEQDPALIEQGVSERVILATPTTLIALLKAVSYGWSQQALAENAREIAELGRELYRRLATFGGHFGEMGRALEKAVETYNSAIRSLETRVFPQGRRFLRLEAARGLDEIPVAEQIEQRPRIAQVAELTEGGEAPGSEEENPAEPE